MDVLNVYWPYPCNHGKIRSYSNHTCSSVVMIVFRTFAILAYTVGHKAKDHWATLFYNPSGQQLPFGELEICNIWGGGGGGGGGVCIR